MPDAWIIQFRADDPRVGMALSVVLYHRAWPAWLRVPQPMNSLLLWELRPPGVIPPSQPSPHPLPPEGRAVYFGGGGGYCRLIPAWPRIRLRRGPKPNAGAAITRLIGLRAKTAVKWNGNGQVQRGCGRISQSATLVLVGPGERLAVDGESPQVPSWSMRANDSVRQAPVDKQAGSDRDRGHC